MSGRRKQSYCDSYAETFTFIKKSTKGEHHAYCKSCNCDISISAGGANDIKRHMNNDKHKKNAEALQRASLHTQPLSSFCKKEDLSVIRAEVLFTDFLVEHSIQPAGILHLFINVNMSSVSAFYWFLKCTSPGASGGFAPLTPTGALPLERAPGPPAVRRSLRSLARYASQNQISGISMLAGMVLVRWQFVRSSKVDIKQSVYVMAV